MESSAELKVWLWSDQSKDRSLLDNAAQEFGWDVTLKPPSDEAAVSAHLSLAPSALEVTIDQLVMLIAVANDESPRQVLKASRDRIRGNGRRLGSRPRRRLRS
ncbi:MULTISPECIES: hypothetical protein [unclassified Kribbella]|uniref:hypothetical protein n=1 Tax=unclassified Kribbella TaxID=2644121 RepID=UPI0037A396FC|nr:hypothetical protein OG817_17715 [Kribbella sp. NBC_00889]